MKKTARNIIILLVVLLVLGGAVALLTMLPTDGGGEESSESSETVERAALLDRDAEDIESMVIKNSQDEYTIVPDTGDSSLTFTLEGYEDYDFNTAQVSANVHTVLDFKASRELGSQDNLDAFGLGSGGAVLTVNYKDGGSDKLVLGDLSPETSGRYVLKDNEVYIVAGVPGAFLESKFSYFYTDVYKVPDMTEVTVDDEGESTEKVVDDRLDHMTLSGAHFPKEISVSPSSKYLSGYGITEPITAETGNTKFSDLLTSLKSLSASSVVDAGVKGDKLQEYGLSEPDAEISFSMNGTEHELIVSAKDSAGMRYLMADDSDIVYQVENSAVTNWADSSLMDLRMSYVWIANIKDVKKLTVTLDGDEVRTYEITREKNEEKSTDTSIEYDITEITRGDGSTIDYETYQPFYQKLIGVAVFTVDDAEYSGKPVMKAEYEYFNGETNTVEYYAIPGMSRYAAVLDGKYNGQVRGSDLDAVKAMAP